MSPFTGAAQVSLVQAWDQVCQGDNTVQLQDALRAGLLPGLQRAVSSLVTQRTQARLMQTYKDMLACLLYTSPSPRDRQKSRMPSSA